MKALDGVEVLGAAVAAVFVRRQVMFLPVREAQVV